MIIPWHPLAELVKALLIWPWLETFATVAAASAWPLAVLAIVLVLRKQAVELIKALVTRMGDLEEVSGPAGLGAKFRGQLGDAREALASEPLPEPDPDDMDPDEPDPGNLEGGEPNPDEPSPNKPDDGSGSQATPEPEQTPSEAPFPNTSTPTGPVPIQVDSLDGPNRSESLSDQRAGWVSSRSSESRWTIRPPQSEKLWVWNNVASQSLTDTNRELVEALAETAPTMAVVQAYKPVEQAIKRYLQALGRIPKSGSVLELQRSKTVPPGIMQAVELLSIMRDDVAHNGAVGVTTKTALAYADTAQVAANDLNELTRKMLTKESREWSIQAQYPGESDI